MGQKAARDGKWGSTHKRKDGEYESKHKNFWGS